MENNLPDKEEGPKPSPIPRHFDDLAKSLDKIIEKSKPRIDEIAERMSKQVDEHFKIQKSK